MQVWKLTGKNTKGLIEKAVVFLQKGKVLACPTDTVYGFVADATNIRAARMIFRIKGREKGKPIPIFVKDIAMAKSFAKAGKAQEVFLGKVWPGKVTAVLKSTNKLPKELGTAKSIGLRIPKYEFLNLLLNAYGKPLTGTSANISGKPSCSSAAQVVAQFQKRKYQPDILLDAGVLPKSKPSKVVDITNAKQIILRE